jgi:predicted HD phosphohydrolase
MCGNTATNDILDVSHIFPKSTWPLVRFHLLNCKILCRKCHEWWHANIQQAADWIQQYLGSRKYAELIAAVTNPDPMFKNLSKVETYLKSEIRKYS